MSILVRTVDQVLGSAATEGPQLSFPVGAVTAREIVSSRVRLEVDRCNSDPSPRVFPSLVTPSCDERELNEPLRSPRRQLDADRQVEVAVNAVLKGRVIIMFNGEQVMDIDAPLIVTPVSEARFLKLVPLVGG
jgi:hypothetical protein